MTADEPVAARLVLFAPPLDGASDVAAALAAALAAADIAAVILAVPPMADQRALLALLAPVVAAVQGGGAAALLAGGLDLVGKAGADGVHVAGSAAAEAAERFRPARIVGAGALLTRDEAMAAAEVADYVMFGEPLPGRPAPPFAAVVERVGWWAELFEPPCVGFAADLDGVAALAAAGADFVALGEAVWRHPAGAVAALAIASAALAQSGAPA